MQARSRQEQPPRPWGSSSSSELMTTSTTASKTTESSVEAASSIHTSDTNYGLISLQTDCGDEAIGAELTPEEIEWLKLAREFTAAEKPFKEQKGFRVARKLRTWHPKRGVTWSFLRRLYNGRQDMKDEEIANIAELIIE